MLEEADHGLEWQRAEGGDETGQRNHTGPWARVLHGCARADTDVPTNLDQLLEEFSWSRSLGSCLDPAAGGHSQP